MKMIAFLALFLGGLLLITATRDAAAQPKPGQAGYDRWQGFHCDEIWAKLRSHRPITADEREMLEGCTYSVAPKYPDWLLKQGPQKAPGNGINEPFRNSAAKVPPGTFLPPQPPKQYPNPKVLRLPPT
ncbi:MAG: hypothetical protein IVW54_06845 [Candidatus Binataceae bacterium]|nr:hypothetical protein [Candidatus Binataceae bacterium]